MCSNKCLGRVQQQCEGCGAAEAAQLSVKGDGSTSVQQVE